MPSLVEIVKGVSEKKIDKFHQCIFTILSPLRNGRGPSFEQT